MNNQLIEPKLKTYNIAIATLIVISLIAGILLSIYYFQMSDPYVQEVLSITGNKIRGEAIFQINCAGCHGDKGKGNVGPTLENISKHKSSITLINQVISGKTPPMPKFQPSSQNMADLLTYLKEL